MSTATSSATPSALDAVLKQIYRSENYGEATYKDAPLVGLLPKFTDFGGKNMPIPIKWANPAGVSNTFSNAQGNTYASRFDAFTLTRRKVYGTAKIDGEGADVSEGEAAAFIASMKSEVDGVMDAVTQKLESDLFRAGTGSIGQVSSGSTVSAQTITLANINDVVNFEVGMTLVASATDGAANRTGTELLAAINRNTGVLTATSAAWNTVITALAASDFLMRQGDLNLAFHGLASWVPVTAPTSTAFFGVDRTQDVTRLGGQRYDASSSGESYEEALIEGQGIIGREGGKADTILMNNVDFRRLIKATGSRVQYPRENGSRSVMGEKGARADLSFSTLRLQGDYGPLDILPAPKCPQGRAYVLAMDSWVLASKGTLPKILMRDGLRVQRIYNDDGYEVRVGGYGNLGNKAPGHNCVVTLPST